MEILLPGVFTLVLLGCLAHLAYCVFQAQAEHTCQAQYAISAFAN